MPTPFIKLSTNIPVFGTIKYADFVKSNKEGYSDQIKVKGQFHTGDPAAAYEASVYLHMAMEGELTKMGVIGERQSNGSYKMLCQPSVRITKKEEGTRRFTEIIRLDGAYPSPATSQSPQHQTAASPSTPPSTVHQQSAPPTQAAQPPQSAKARFDLLSSTMGACVHEAKVVWENQGAASPDFLATTAHTLFIQACRDGAMVPRPPKPAAESQLNHIAEMAVKLKMEDKALIELVRRHGATDFKSISDDMAGGIVAELDGLCKKTLF